MLRHIITAITINAVAFGGMIHVANAQLAQDESIRIRAEQARFRAEELECLALNIYFETHASSLADAMAVSDVVLNRVASRHFPATICEVVKEGYKRGSRSCQFSWYCDGKSDDIISNELDIYTVASDIAHRIYSGAIDDVTNGATHYHADYVIPAWAATKIRTIKIDDHIFYRWEF